MVRASVSMTTHGLQVTMRSIGGDLRRNAGDLREEWKAMINHKNTIETSGGGVPIDLRIPPAASAVAVLGHGAGAGMASDFMQTMATGLLERDVGVALFDFPYMAAGRRSPDRQPVAVEAFRAVAAEVGEHADGRRLVLGGKSFGGRMASLAAADGLACDGLVFFGYPLHPPGRPDKLRADHLPDVGAPMLFIEGTRDPFCPLETLRRVLDDLSIDAEIEVIGDGDHSLKVRKTSGRSTSDAWTQAVDAAAAWIGRKL